MSGLICLSIESFLCFTQYSQYRTRQIWWLSSDLVYIGPELWDHARSIFCVLAFFPKPVSFMLHLRTAYSKPLGGSLFEPFMSSQIPKIGSCCRDWQARANMPPYPELTPNFALRQTGFFNHHLPALFCCSHPCPFYVRWHLCIWKTLFFFFLSIAEPTVTQTQPSV